METLNGITSAVTQFWNFVFGPLVLCITATLLFWYLEPPLFRKSVAALSHRFRSFSIDPGRYRTIEFIGLPKMLPLLALFLVLLGLHAIDSTALFVGSLLPAHVSYLPTSMDIAFGDTDKLLVLWSQHPEIKWPYDLSQITQVLIDKYTLVQADSFAAKNLKLWEDNASRKAMTFIYMKFLFLCAVLLLIARIRLNKFFDFRFARYVFFMFLTIGVSYYAIYQVVAAYQQVGYARAAILRQAIDVNSESARGQNYISSNESELRSRQAAERNQWWSFSIIDMYAFKNMLKLMHGID